ncbi:MAG: cell division protein ZapA [Candidatus Marinimicrobia bacterium]|nr:cell division protein ZapA [Candidatus Neomarinimicrobiota bacterium]
MDKSQENLVRVVIFGQEYMIRGKADSGYIQKVAKYVNDKMEEVESAVSSIHTPLKIAILAAMSITDELFSLKNKKDKETEEINKRSEGLIEEIESVLKE